MTNEPAETLARELAVGDMFVSDLFNGDQLIMRYEVTAVPVVNAIRGTVEVRTLRLGKGGHVGGLLFTRDEKVARAYPATL